VAEDVMEAVFVTAEVLQSFSPKVAERLSKPADVVDPNDPTFHKRTFPVPRDFMLLGTSGQPNDDTAKPVVVSPRRSEAKGILHSQGINFPEGASAVYNPITSELTVTNTLANLDLVETFLMPLDGGIRPRNLSLTLHLFEAPGPLLRRLLTERAAIQDHRPMLEALRSAANMKQALNLSTLRLETKSGQRASAIDGIEKPYISEVGIGDDGQPFINHEMRTLGLSVEVDPVIGPDGWTIDLNAAVRYTTAPPEDYTLRYTDPPTGHEITIPQFRFHQTETTTAVTLQDGTVKLLSVWKPTGPAFEGKDVLQCALIEAHIVVVK
jgi:hypothetical protein